MTVEFAMLKVAGNRLIPFFIIPRCSSSPSTQREPEGQRAPSLLRPHSDWTH